MELIRTLSGNLSIIDEAIKYDVPPILSMIKKITASEKTMEKVTAATEQMIQHNDLSR